MNRLNQKCRFCLKYLILDADNDHLFKCDTCQMEYLIFRGKLIGQSYLLKDPEIDNVYCNILSKCTYILINTESPWIKTPIRVEKAWPHKTPQETLKIAKQIIKLKAFL